MMGWALVHSSPMKWKRLLACVTGSANQQLLLRNEHLATENRTWGCPGKCGHPSGEAAAPKFEFERLLRAVDSIDEE
jgi:hypothetical protein